MKTIDLPFRLTAPRFFSARPRPQGRNARAVKTAVMAGPGKVLRLSPDRVIRLDRDSGVSRIELESGTLWLTDTPSRGDIVLREGQKLPVRGGWPVVVQALTESIVRLS